MPKHNNFKNNNKNSNVDSKSATSAGGKGGGKKRRRGGGKGIDGAGDGTPPPSTAKRVKFANGKQGHAKSGDKAGGSGGEIGENPPPPSGGGGPKLTVPTVEAKSATPQRRKGIARAKTSAVMDIIFFKGKHCTFNPYALRDLADEAELAMRKRAKKARRKEKAAEKRAGTDVTRGRAGEKAEGEPNADGGGKAGYTSVNTLEFKALLERVARLESAPTETAVVPDTDLSATGVVAEVL